MERNAISGIMVMLLLVSMLTLAFGVQPVKAESMTWTVDDDGGKDFTKIQDAINAASPGDTIYVYNGTYNEHVTVNKSLTLAGESKRTTIIDGSLDGIAIEIVADDVQISEFTIRNGYIGVLVNSNGNTVSNNNITLNIQEGLFVENCIGNVIANNLIGFNGLDGVYMSNTSNTALQNNMITSNNWTGVHIEASYGNTVYNNTLGNNTIFGLRLDDSNNISVVGNTLYWNENAGVNYFNLTDSIFYHNNFLNGTEQISSDDSPNVWDSGYPSGGNYWIDYSGIDSYNGQSQNETGSDGIGDVAYDNIDNANQDNYPLIGPICFFDTGAWNGVSYSVHIVSNSTVSKFQLDEAKKTMSFNVTADTGLGFCRVTIPNVIVQDLWQGNYKVLVDGRDPLMTDNWSDETYTYIYITYLHSERAVVIRSSDYTPPTISIISPENISYPVKDVSLIFTVNESTSWIGYSLDGQMNMTISGNTTIVVLSDGAHVITVYANDTVGNMGFSDTIFFTIDTSSPNIEIFSPENTTYTASSVSLNFYIDEPTSWIGYSLDWQNNVTITGNTTISGLTIELHSLIVYANDTAGNIGSSNIVYFTLLDSTPPSVSILSPENKTYATTDVPLNFTIDEAVVWVAYSLDNKANVTITGNITLSGLSEGLHSLVVYASDAAENIGASQMIYFTIETQQEAFARWIVVIAVMITVVVAPAILVYFTQVKKAKK